MARIKSRRENRCSQRLMKTPSWNFVHGKRCYLPAAFSKQVEDLKKKKKKKPASRLKCQQKDKRNPAFYSISFCVAQEFSISFS